MTNRVDGNASEDAPRRAVGEVCREFGAEKDFQIKRLKIVKSLPTRQESSCSFLRLLETT